MKILETNKNNIPRNAGNRYTYSQENRKSVLLFDFSENLFIGIDVGVHIAAKETGLGKLLSLGIGDDDRGIAPDLVLGLKFPVLATTPG